MSLVPDDLDRQRLQLEEARFRHTVQIDEKRFSWDRSGKIWSQLLALVPIVAIVIGYYFNSQLESDRSVRTQNVAALTLQRQFIDRQLADLYYPIKLRFEKDTAVWTLARQLSPTAINTDPAFSKTVETGILLPNHEEILAIISANFSLLKNSEEKYDTTKLMTNINQYQRHVAAYRTLRKLDIYSQNAIQVCTTCGFPLEFPGLIDARIVDLEKQRTALIDKIKRL
jgi:hypothetical protein